MTVWEVLIGFVGVAVGIVANEVLQHRRATRRPALPYHPRFQPHRECLR